MYVLMYSYTYMFFISVCTYVYNMFIPVNRSCGERVR